MHLFRGYRLNRMEENSHLFKWSAMKALIIFLFSEAEFSAAEDQLLIKIRGESL